MSFQLKPIVAVMIITANASAYAQTVPVVACAATGPGAVACVGAAVAVHEIVQLANGKEPLGPNGEGMKVVNGAGDVVAGIFGWGGGRGGSRPSREEMKQERLDRAPK